MTQLSALDSWPVYVWRTMVTGSPSYATWSVTLTVVVSTRRQETFTSVSSQTFISFFKQPAAARPKGRRYTGGLLNDRWYIRIENGPWPPPFLKKFSVNLHSILARHIRKGSHISLNFKILPRPHFFHRMKVQDQGYNFWFYHVSSKCTVQDVQSQYK